MRYKGPPHYLHNKMKLEAELDKTQIQMLFWNYEHLPPLITSIEDSYERFFKSLDLIVQMHKIPSIRTLTENRRENQVMLDVD